jgi:nitric oxide reductase NorD protein
MTPAPYSLAELEALLDDILEVEFSFRNTQPPAQALAPLGREAQDYLLDWTRRVKGANLELGYRFARHAPRALGLLDTHLLEAWALHAMDRYDREGLRPALAVIDGLDGFLDRQRERVCGVLLAEQEGVLHGLLQGLAGRRLRLAEGEGAYTDSETLFLPRVMARCAAVGDNFLLYKAGIAMLWAQIRFGTLRLLVQKPFTETAPDPLAEGEAVCGSGWQPRKPDQSQTPEVAVANRSHPEAWPAPLLELYLALETLRLQALIRRELPGLHREMVRLQGLLDQPQLPPAWQALAEELAQPGQQASDSLALARRERGRLPPYPPFPWQGALRPEAVLACTRARLEREKARFKVGLGRLIEEPGERREAKPAPRRLEKRWRPDPNAWEGQRLEILLDGKPLPLPDELRQLLGSILLDLSDLPDDYLEPAGPGDYDPKLLGEEDEAAQAVWAGTYHEQGAVLVDEWDYRRKAYRKQWCAVREREVEPLEDGFAARTLAKYLGLVKHLRRTFEALRDEDRRLRRQPDGDGIDLDALVEALADARDGREMSDRLCTRLHRNERNIAVVFLVDMSGSTKGWINDAERESLLLLCESLETLGDRYAIYGFSGNTRKRCELFRIKTFDQPYDAGVKARIAGIRPQDYTRMGFAIRRMNQLLAGMDAKTRLLITISDGKPDDYDNYRGDYGIEDTRRALQESRRQGIHPYCITIDDQARDYLPHLYGPAAYTLVDEVRSLPLKVSDIYRRLTT